MKERYFNSILSNGVFVSILYLPHLFGEKVYLMRVISFSLLSAQPQLPKLNNTVFSLLFAFRVHVSSHEAHKMGYVSFISSNLWEIVIFYV